jgi:hypothetical protein
MRGAFFFTLFIALAACGGDDDDDDTVGDGDADADSDADADGDADACVADPADVDLTGVWGVQASLQVSLTERPEAIVHLCPAGTATATATLYLRLEVTSQDGADIQQTVSVCDIQLPAPAGAVAPCDENPETVSIAISLGPELAELLPTLQFDGVGTLAVEDGCATYRPDDLVLILGTDFAANDRDTPLPFWDPTCSTDTETCVAEFVHVVDQDADGDPGVSLHAESEILAGDAFVTFRTVPTLAGVVRDADTVVGTVVPELEYALVGSDISLGQLALDTPTVIENLPLIEPLAEGSTFTALRADDWGDGSCAAILERADEFSR